MMSLSSSPSFVYDGVELFIIRHGERVDLTFGMDWVCRTFNSIQPSDSSSHTKKNSEIESKLEANEEKQSEEFDVDATDAMIHSPRLSSSPIPSSSSSSSRVHYHYNRWNLNLPRPDPIHLPGRSPSEYDGDSPLTMLGHWQASLVGEGLNGKKISYIYCSPALRSIQTAHNLVESIGLNKFSDWKGIRIEYSLFEWCGYYQKLPHWLTPAQLKSSGLHVDINYRSKSPVPSLSESEKYYYIRSGNVVKSIFDDVEKESFGGKIKGNIMIVGHAGSLDTCSYQLLRSHLFHPSNDSLLPTDDELCRQQRTRIHANYVGVARLRYHGDKNQWKIADDLESQFSHSSNDHYSFHSSYSNYGASSHDFSTVSPAFKQFFEPKSAQSLALDRQMDSLAPNVSGLFDLSFRRIFGTILTLSHHAALSVIKSDDYRSISRVIAEIKQAVNPIMAKFLPEWLVLNSYIDGFIGNHVVRMFLVVDLMLGPLASEDERAKSEFLLLPKHLKNVLSWSILLHDIAKTARYDHEKKIIRDPAHPFRSSAVAARILARNGFAVSSSFYDQVEAWAQKAIQSIQQTENGGTIHDNRAIRSLLITLKQLFGTNTTATLIIEVTMLHQSINWLPSIPPATPLTDDEIKSLIADGLISKELIDVLAVLAVADSASYNIERPEIRNNHVQEIRGTITKLNEWYNITKSTPSTTTNKQSS